MDRAIVGFQQDAAVEWVAELECGHQRHVRHNPLWEDHAWVVEEVSRRARLGSLLPCGLCDAESQRAHTDAKMRGLCEEGADEVSRRPRYDGK